MAVYVDALAAYGWRLGGREIESCHLFADSLDELHEFAKRIGLRRTWFQYRPGRLPHYDLTPGKHLQARRAGAQLLDRAAAVAKWREIKAEDAARLAAVARRLSGVRELLDNDPFSMSESNEQKEGNA